jgi:hypothetical protein
MSEPFYLYDHWCMSVMPQKSRIVVSTKHCHQEIELCITSKGPGLSCFCVCQCWNGVEGRGDCPVYWIRSKTSSKYKIKNKFIFTHVTLKSIENSLERARLFPTCTCIPKFRNVDFYGAGSPPEFKTDHMTLACVHAGHFSVNREISCIFIIIVHNQ